MIQKIAAILLLCCTASLAASAQLREYDKDRKEEQAEQKATSKAKVDMNVFRRQILALPEFSEQRRTLPELKKKVNGVPKIYAVVDSTGDIETAKTFAGYIAIAIGDHVVDIYELTYDRAQKKIIKIKPTGQTVLEDDPLPTDRSEAKPKKKKRGDDDEDEDEDEDDDRPARNKRKQKDKDDEDE